jgi:hypothetical protein
MPFKFQHIITNYKGEDSFTHDYYQIEHTTIGMIKAKNMALEEYYKLYPNADEEKYLKVVMQNKYVDKEDIPEDKI